MRLVRPTTRYVRLSHRQQYLLSTTRVPLLRPRRADSPLQNNIRQPFVPLDVLSSHPKHQLPEEQAVVERNDLAVNQPDHSHICKLRRVKTDARGVPQDDVRERTKNDGSSTVEHVNDAKPTKSASSVNTAGPTYIEPVQELDYEKIKEYANAIDRITITGDPNTWPSRNSLACSADTPPQDPLPKTPSNSTGFSIDVQGQLRIKSKEAALRKLRTTLIVSSVSRNLVEADFTRLLAHTPGPGRGRGGFIQAIPGRDSDFNRLSYWILLFDCPYAAASYQHRMNWYHANALLNLPVNPYTAATTMQRELTPPEGYVDPLSGEDTWKRLHEFCVLLPTQRFNVTAILEPFPETVRTDLRNHKLWRFPSTNPQAWPVRVWISDYQLDVSLVKDFLDEDGRRRERKWKLIEGIESVEPMFYTAFNSKGRRINSEGHQMSKAQVALRHSSPQNNWVIRFCAEEDALLFWRTWHRRPFPKSLSEAPEGERLLHVDPLW